MEEIEEGEGEAGSDADLEQTTAEVELVAVNLASANKNESVGEPIRWSIVPLYLSSLVSASRPIGALRLVQAGANLLCSLSHFVCTFNGEPQLRFPLAVVEVVVGVQ